jgi:hypothetical protein
MIETATAYLISGRRRSAGPTHLPVVATAEKKPPGG